MLQRKFFSVTYPECTPKITNLFKCCHDQLLVNMPTLDIDTKLGLIYPAMINIHFLEERFLHLPFKGILDLENTKVFSDLSIDFTNTTDKPGTITAEKFKGSKGAFDDLNSNFIMMKPGDRINIPKGAVKVDTKMIRECAVRSVMILDKCAMVPDTSFSQSFYTVGSVTPHEVFDAITNRNEEILQELSTMFASKEFRKKMEDNENTVYLQGKYFPQLNVIADLDKNLFIKLNTSADYNSNQYVILKVKDGKLDGVQEAIETVRANFAKLVFKEGPLKRDL